MWRDAQTGNDGYTGKNENEKNHNRRCRQPPFTTITTNNNMWMCVRESGKDIQKCAPYTIWVYRVKGRVNKGRVQCARAWIGPESWIIHYYYFICLFPGDRPRPWVIRNWLFGLRCVWKEAADRVYILCAFVYNIMCSVQDPGNTLNPPYARVHEQLYINTLPI